MFYLLAGDFVLLVILFTALWCWRFWFCSLAPSAVRQWLCLAPLWEGTLISRHLEKWPQGGARVTLYSEWTGKVKVRKSCMSMWWWSVFLKKNIYSGGTRFSIDIKRALTVTMLEYLTSTLFTCQKHVIMIRKRSTSCIIWLVLTL